MNNKAEQIFNEEKTQILDTIISEYEKAIEQYNQERQKYDKRAERQEGNYIDEDGKAHSSSLQFFQDMGDLARECKANFVKNTAKALGIDENASKKDLEETYERLCTFVEGKLFENVTFNRTKFDQALQNKDHPIVDFLKQVLETISLGLYESKNISAKKAQSFVEKIAQQRSENKGSQIQV